MPLKLGRQDAVSFRFAGRTWQEEKQEFTFHSYETEDNAVRN